MTELRAVCVFAGSSPGARPGYVAAAIALGTELARRDIAVVYGGASVGLMGAVADAALAAGGEVIGVITEALVSHEVAHGGLTRLDTVPTMHARKQRMADLSDAFVMLPGGFGTYEEFMEVVTWTQLGVHTKPCGLLDVEDFYAPLRMQIDRAVTDRFIRPEHAALVCAADSPTELLAALAAFVAPPNAKWLDRDDA